LQSFISKEITSCNVNKLHKNEFLIFNDRFDKNGILFNELEKQLIKKNLYIASLYYRRINLSKLEILLENNKDKVEDLLCEMIYKDLISGKIDRL